MRLKIYIIIIEFLLTDLALLFAQDYREDEQLRQPIQREEIQERAVTQAPQTSEAVEKETKSSAPQAAPIIEIKQLDTEEPRYSLELRDVDISDLFRVLAHDYKLNLLIDEEVKGKITASFTSIALDEALEGIAEISNLVLKKKGTIIRVSPNLITKIFSLKYIEAKKLLEGSGASAEGMGAASATDVTASTGGTPSSAGEPTATAAASGSTNSSGRTESNTIYDLLSDQGKILLGTQPNSIMAIDYPPQIEKIEEYLKEIDKKMTTRVFKLKYLKASDVVGESSATQDTPASGTSSTTSAGSSSSGAASSSNGS